MHHRNLLFRIPKQFSFGQRAQRVVRDGLVPKGYVLGIISAWQLKRTKSYGSWYDDNCSLWNVGWYLYTFDRIEKVSTASIYDAFRLIKNKRLNFCQRDCSPLYSLKMTLNDPEALLYFDNNEEFMNL